MSTTDQQALASELAAAAATSGAVRGTLAGLRYIDDGADSGVFESIVDGDYPETSTLNEEEVEESIPGLDSSSVNLKAALKLFYDRDLFAPQAPEDAKQARLASRETVTERLDRIRAELNELTQLVEDGGERSAGGDSDSFKELMDTVSRLQIIAAKKDTSELSNQLGPMALSEKDAMNHLANLINTDTGVKTGELAIKPQNDADGYVKYVIYRNKDTEGGSAAGSEAYLERAASLDARLARIEKALGADLQNVLNQSAADIGMDKSSGEEIEDVNVSLILRSLSSRVRLLKETELEALDLRAKRLLRTLNELQDEAPGSIPHDMGMVERTYELLSKWESLDRALPQLINRVEELTQFRFEAENYGRTLQALTAQQTEIESLLNSNGEGLDNVRKMFKQDLINITSNMQSLEQRILSLQ
eukprot:Clim_evm28s251 gene=Clim_evmTU28s251